ncbi:hypothetical protein ScPMuIL_008799 [Solemya velum]
MVDVNTRVLMPIEAETIVENLKKFDLIRIGNTEWSRQHEVVEKLNIQAVVNAPHRKMSSSRTFHLLREAKKLMKETVTPDSRATTIEELEDQAKKLNFDICVKCVSLLRYVTDHLDSLPLSVLNRLLDTHDLPVLMVELVENPPWSRRRNGEVSKYIDSKWQEVSMEDSLKVTKTEGQVWICLYHLLMEQACQQKYDLNPYRKNTVLKLRSYLTEVLLDQIPVLGEMQRYLEHLSMMDPPPAKKDLILEQVPEIRNEILRQYSGKWTKIAKKQMKTVFSQSSAAMRDQAKRWADTYNFDVLEGLLTDPPKCALCGDQATKRCSRCQNEWYCRRECQVKHWSKHKKACDLLHNTLDELKAKEQNGKAS